MATAATAEAGHEAAKAGMPQLDFSTFPNQIFWFVVAFFLLYLMISRIVLPRIGAILDERSGIIGKDLADAARMKEEAVQAEADYNKALTEARTNAQRIGAEAKAEIQKTIDAELAKADAEIAAQSAEAERHIRGIREGAMKSVEDVAKETARAVVAAILPGVADDKAVDAAVAARLKG
jgi:F-type H+-transporting ATPase subunit b